MAGNKTLEQMRIEIDAADQKLLEALAHRMEIVKEVGEYKKAHNLPPLDTKRWNEVLESKLNKADSLGLTTALLKEIYEVIHKHALIVEESIKTSDPSSLT